MTYSNKLWLVLMRLEVSWAALLTRARLSWPWLSSLRSLQPAGGLAGSWRVSAGSLFCLMVCGLLAGVTRVTGVCGMSASRGLAQAFHRLCQWPRSRKREKNMRGPWGYGWEVTHHFPCTLLAKASYRIQGTEKYTTFAWEELQRQLQGARIRGGMKDGGHFYHQSTICFSDSKLHFSLKVQLSSTFSRKLYLTPPLSFSVNSGLTTLTAVLTLCPNPGSSHWPALWQIASHFANLAFKGPRMNM